MNKHLAVIAALALVFCWSPLVAAPRPLLTEAEIAPCNELLSYRAFLWNETNELSNLEFALSHYPFKPLYDLEWVRIGLSETAKSIAALESGSADAQRREFGIVYTGQDAVDRLMTDRRALCMLNVRLRQLQGAKPKKATPVRKR